MPRKRAEEDVPIIDVVDRLDDAAIRRLLVTAAESHDDVARAVRLAGADDADRLAVLVAAVDDRLRTRRHLDYWASTEWARDAAPVVDALAAEVDDRPSAELVGLLQRAAAHLVKVILRADDSNGMIGGLAADVLELHRRACAAGVAEPLGLAKWMVRFAFEDQDFFPIDPVAYASALGDVGLSVYRRDVAKLSEPRNEVEDHPPVLRDPYGGFPSFAARYTVERLAVLDHDVDRIVELLGGELSSPYHFFRVAEAMVEIDRVDDALAWARRGITETSGWQVAKLYDLSAAILAERGELVSVLDLRREQHSRMASALTYSVLQGAADQVGVWAAEIGGARDVLGKVDKSGLVDVLLAAGESDAAWSLATSDASWKPGADRWRRLAEAREPIDPAGALRVYIRLTEDALVDADRRNYQQAVKYLKAARSAAIAAGLTDEFIEYLVALREQNRRRPTLMQLLDKAKLP
jgi:hypothetical protein